MDSFSTPIKVNSKVFENLKILQNIGINSEFRHLYNYKYNIDAVFHSLRHFRDFFNQARQLYRSRELNESFGEILTQVCRMARI